MTTPALPFDPGHGISPFDRLMHRDEDGTEWWSARDLMPHLDYSKWQNFEPVVLKVRDALTHVSAGRDMVTETSKHVQRGFGGTQEVTDYRLTRGAVYLVALECDGSKPTVAAVKRYFAAQTRRAELSAERLPQAPGAGNALVVRALQQTVEALAEQDRQITALYAAQQDQGRELAEQREVTLALAARVDTVAGREGWFSCLAFAKRHGLDRKNRTLDAMRALGRRAASITRATGLDPEKVPDGRYGAVNTYPEWALDRALDELVGEGLL